MSEDPYRHPGGRTCAGAMLLLMTTFTAGAGALAGVIWAALH